MFISKLRSSRLAIVLAVATIFISKSLAAQTNVTISEDENSYTLANGKPLRN